MCLVNTSVEGKQYLERLAYTNQTIDDESCGRYAEVKKVAQEGMESNHLECWRLVKM